MKIITMWQDVLENDKDALNALATHPLQAFEWGEFREKTGVKVIRKGFFKEKKLTKAFQLTIHKIPHTPWTIGYLPKGIMPSKEEILELKKIGKEYKCIFIQLEPSVQKDKGSMMNDKKEKDLSLVLNLLSLHRAVHPLFAKYTFVLDLTKSREELLKQMSQKTRYNIKVAQKHGVIIKEEISEEAFHEYLKLTHETTNRQGFYAHTSDYHKKMWKTLRQARTINENRLSAHLLIAYYKNIPLVSWVLFVFKDTLYYPYGASSMQHRETMASNLMMWEAIQFGKKLGLHKFDMWGALGETPNPKDSWYGFHKFKVGYGPQLVEFGGSYDLVIHPTLYVGYAIADKLRWLLLRLKR